MILKDRRVDADAFAARTGWVAKPEGLCKGDVCVPAPTGEQLDVEMVAERLRMPLVGGELVGGDRVWALGPSSLGRALETAVAPELVLPDRNGNAFALSSLRGRKVILVAWASW